MRVLFKISGKDIDVYRNFSFEREANIFIPDETLSYKLIPRVCRNAFSSDFQIVYCTNSIGLREKELENTSKFKILFLGDSLTFGEGVPCGSRFSDLIEKQIKSIYTINAGVPGYGIHQMHLWLKLHGLSLRPNLVICSIAPGILRRAIYKELKQSPHILIRGGRKVSPRYKIEQITGIIMERTDRLLKESYFYSFMRVRIKIFFMKLNLQARDKKVWEEINSKYGNGYRITEGQQGKAVREELFRIFLDFQNLLTQRKIQLLVVNVSNGSMPWLEEFFIKQNIKYLDMAPQLLGAGNITFEIDQHYNTRGHSIIAGLLKDYISEKYKEDIASVRNNPEFE